MNDLNRNTRTLVVCFVVAIFSLIPLRFYEFGNQVVANKSQVLGLYREVDISLPDSGLRSESVPVLEFPYEEIEASESEVVDCVPRSEVDRVVENLTEVLKVPGLEGELVTAAMEEIEKMESRVCR